MKSGDGSEGNVGWGRRGGNYKIKNVDINFEHLKMGGGRGGVICVEKPPWVGRRTDLEELINPSALFASAASR